MTAEDSSVNALAPRIAVRLSAFHCLARVLSAVGAEDARRDGSFLCPNDC